ncbi:Similar to ADAMTS6: A disintegrin and metalloproteinase with thrombospondin motifs 6 (Homo sapiens) [Cotesia congregata]|uniref:Similar to ADAMTS6: A disintegrin and metalloproteinase with thrombospondin motifs 6 (Homo sapiens) n=1 Tax=Cotesia congregata TaxID=51543 RepID=A0A8J2HKM2_COTCN|nr:Similar to ADAMTS6: A disintegrin and metalloproteinase with thrombospondin motifs 6 (Homo sapiens) [Cotesia congregata]
MAILKLIAGLNFIGAVLSSSLELHHHMTPEERQQVFYTDGTDVPPYEVVTIHSSKVEKRDVNAGHVFEVNAYGENVKAWITLTEGIFAGVNTPICGVRSRRDGRIDIYKYPNKMKEIEATVFKNTNQGITMTVNYRSDGTRMMNGIVGSKNWYVKPVPERLTNSISRYRRSVDNINSDYDDKSYHIVYQIPMTANNSTLMAPLTQSKKSKRAIRIPPVIYPEVLVILDWGLYRQLGGTIESAVPYVLSFWNGVDLKYRGLRNPRYRLNIAAIFLSEDPNALSFIQNSISYGPTSLDSQLVIQHSARWLFDHQKIVPLNEYDVAVILTNRRIFTNKNGRPSYGLGRAWISGACSTNDQYGVHRSAVVHDEGTFGGIHAAAHELGHLFGANHDGIEHPDCPTHVGTIMADHPILNTEYSYSWSWCSQNDLSRFLNYYNPTCLYNVPNPGTPVPRLLPGKMMNAHQQCSMINRNTQAYITTDICKKLVCYDAARRVWYNNVDWSAADGTYCAPGRMCLYGKCVSEN